jgi:hypothetical protein
MAYTNVRLQLDFLAFLPMFGGGMVSAIGLWWLTSTLGASVASGAEAVLCTFLVLVMMWTVQSLVGWRASTVAYAAPALVWPYWWTVLNSMASRQVDPASGVVPFRFAQTWYSGVWFKALVETGLLALFAWAVTRTLRASGNRLGDASAGHAVPQLKACPRQSTRVTH